ncbi:hypothetical protein E2C01_065719 [Portunus trituberculatus]|uniref:Uncharacterized protein n=1 Tax=Portunus trituberculatus TaxID=210409 RepID=A0A5B7HJM1_PORTR|nr:hypothetical protein [Portunus trituberculatus]
MWCSLASVCAERYPSLCFVSQIRRAALLASHLSIRQQALHLLHSVLIVVSSPSSFLAVPLLLSILSRRVYKKSLVSQVLQQLVVLQTPGTVELMGHTIRYAKYAQLELLKEDR